MERLTEWYDNGLREGVLVKEKRGEKETKVLFEEIDDGYHAMCVLKNYEDTGLTPEQIREIDRLYTEKCREVAELRQRDIPVKVKPLEIYHPVGYRVGMCPKCDAIVRDYANQFCGECGCRLEWGSWEEWEDSHETKNSGGE